MTMLLPASFRGISRATALGSVTVLPSPQRGEMFIATVGYFRFFSLLRSENSILCSGSINISLLSECRISG